ncbi:hypothetical protein BC941DRAFT_216105 [Chlamydoabsidia padenii]|nr:hypothetical protein BC941DRAFT_216105 [Chlamydoabsidia padenii]
MSDISGFDYNHGFEVPSGLGVGSVKAYTTFKHSFYQRNLSGHRHTKSISAVDLWVVSDKFRNYFDFINRTADDIVNKMYSALLEVSFELPAAMNNMDTLMNVLSTRDVTGLLKVRANALKDTAMNIALQNPDRFRPPQLSSVVVLAFLCSGLLSRPDEISWNAPLYTISKRYQYHHSRIVTLPFFF